MRARAQSDDGAIAIIVAVCSVLLLAMAALVVDLGMAMSERRDQQKAADLAALAGGQELPAGDLTPSASDPEVIAVAEYLYANGWETNSAGTEWTVADIASAITNGEEADGEVTLDSLNRIHVITPSQNVDFAFAGAVAALLSEDGADSVDINASATVEIRTILTGVLPFQMPASAQPGILCIKNNNADPCDDQTQSDFGFLDFPRTDVNGANPVLIKNVRDGVQFTPNLIPNAETVRSQALAGEPFEVACTPGSPTGAVLLNYSNPQSGYNCVAPGPGNRASVVVAGLVRNGSCNGRLAVPPGTPGALTIDGCPVSPDKFSTYINPASSLSDPNSWGPIDGAITEDPRFGILPMIASKELADVSGPVKQNPIVRFYGSYYKTLYDQQGDPVPPSTKNNFSGVSSYVFPLNLIDGVAPNDGDQIGYIGGVKVPVLIE